MTPEDRIAGFGGSRGIAASTTYDSTLATNDLPEVHTIFFLDTGRAITTLEDRDGVDLLPQYNGRLADWNSELPVTARDGQYFAKIIVGASTPLAIFTILGKVIS